MRGIFFDERKERKKSHVSKNAQKRVRGWNENMLQGYLFMMKSRPKTFFYKQNMQRVYVKMKHYEYYLEKNSETLEN